MIGGMLFLSRVWKERRFIEIGKAALMTVLLNLWFLLPFLSYYSKGDLWTSTLDYSTYSEWSLRLSGIAGANIAGNYRSLALGLPVVLCAGIAVFWLLTRQRAASSEQEEIPGECVRYLGFLTAAGFVCLFLLSGQFGAWEFMQLSIFKNLFSTIQFPWRLLGLSSAFFTIAGCIALFDSAYLSRYAKSTAVILCAICLLSATRYQEDDFAYEDYTSVYTEGHESKIVGVPKGNNTIVYPYEWRREGLADAVLIPDAIRISDANKVTIESYRREGTTATVSYTASSKKEWIVLPIQCYDGYRAEDELGRAVAIEPNEDQLVSFTTLGDGERHTVTLSFHQKPVFVLATVISILAAVGYACRFSLHPYFLRAGKKKRGALRKVVGGDQDADGI